MPVPTYEIRSAQCLQETEVMIDRLRLASDALLRAVELSRRVISDSRTTLLRIERTLLPSLRADHAPIPGSAGVRRPR